ncbi:MAG: hypothetical protein PHT54_02935 [Candidatus Nanoarchaeia archaeon]|nr:hypothetical protein [Candidatus Nanoarchaeia archaeon]
MQFIEKLKTFKAKFRRDRPLIKKLEVKYLQLLRAVGNQKQVKRVSREFLVLLNKFKKTELYFYLKDDTEKIRKNAIEIMKHPKQNKIKFVLVWLYLILPGTFDATAVVMFFRYLRYKRNNKNGS